MDNKVIASHFQALARTMEYLGENSFKIRSYDKAYDLLKKRDEPVAGLSLSQLQEIEGIGKAISEKIVALVETGKLDLLERYRASMPAGAVALLQVRGLGPKKVKQLVEELEVDSVGELLQAIQENRVVELKGFSKASQVKLKEQLSFFQKSQGFARYADIEPIAIEILAQLRGVASRAELTGEFHRQLPVISELTFIATPDASTYLTGLGFSVSATSAHGVVEEFPTRIILSNKADFAKEWVLSSADPEFIANHSALQNVSDATNEEQVFAKAELPFVPAMQRESASPFPPTPLDQLVQLSDIKGLVHAHSTWSDGSTSIEEMAKAAKKAGFGYLVITDHSQAAGYAHGLSVKRLEQQAIEVDSLNTKLKDFTIFKGIECDILRSGELDYSNEVLAKLDVVIASVHSVLRMDIEDATDRMLAAIRNPYTTMLGHPTGRLLLSRAGYPLHMDKILAACAEHHVAIEINASPYRLDLDWTYVRKAVDLGIKISINPDAHALAGINDVRYGVLVAQKAGLRPAECLNALDAQQFGNYLRERASLVGIS